VDGSIKGIFIMNISKIKLSTVLIPIGTLGFVVPLADFWFLYFFHKSFSIQVDTVSLFVGLVCFPAGIIAWIVEKFGKNQIEVSNQAKNIRNISLSIGIAIIFCFILFAYAMMHAWSGG
jgi:hypothetical protein